MLPRLASRGQCCIVHILNAGPAPEPVLLEGSESVLQVFAARLCAQHLHRAALAEAACKLAILWPY